MVLLSVGVGGGGHMTNPEITTQRGNEEGEGLEGNKKESSPGTSGGFQFPVPFLLREVCTFLLSLSVFQQTLFPVFNSLVEEKDPTQPADGINRTPPNR